MGDAFFQVQSVTTLVVCDLSKKKSHHLSECEIMKLVLPSPPIVSLQWMECFVFGTDILVKKDNPIVCVYIKTMTPYIGHSSITLFHNTFQSGLPEEK